MVCIVQYDRAIGCQAMGDWFLFSEGEEKWIVAGCWVDWRKLAQDRYVSMYVGLDIVFPSESNFPYLRLRLNPPWLFFIHHFQKTVHVLGEKSLSLN